MKKTKIALTGGGTGGHVFPLLALYNFMQSENLEFIWIGEKNSLEEKIARENGIEFHNIKSGKLRRYFDIKNFLDPFKIIGGIFQSLYYLWKTESDIIFSKGGFVSVPACIAGKILGKKIYIHESDTIMGLSNKIIVHLATKVFFTFDNSLIDDKKFINAGQILNPKLIENIDIKKEKNKIQEIIVIAGSQGSKAIYEALANIITNYSSLHFSIVLGEKNTGFREIFQKYDFVDLYDFASQDEIAKLLQKADVSITRAGATSLWEQYYFGLKQIIIPLKNSAGNHQFHNAAYFAEKFSSSLILEDENMSKNLEKVLNENIDFRKEKLKLEGFSLRLEIIKKEIL